MPAKTIIDEREFLELLDKGMLPVEIARRFGVSPAAITKKIKKYRPNPIVQKYTQNHDKQDEQKGKRYTEKKAKYVEARLQGKNPAQAAMIAYNCKTPKSAAVVGSRLEQDPGVKRSMTECLHDEGVTPTYRAKKTRTILDEGSFGDQLKALDHVAKLTGDYAPERHFLHGEVSWDVSLRRLHANLFKPDFQPIDVEPTIKKEGDETGI